MSLLRDKLVENKKYCYNIFLNDIASCYTHVFQTTRVDEAVDSLVFIVYFQWGFNHKEI